MIPPRKPADEPQRQAALRATRMLDSESEERFNRVTRLARRLFDVPIALVSLVDANRQWFKSKQGLTASETPRDISFCGHAILTDEVLVVEDAREDERFVDNPLVTGGPGIRFYAGYPLAAPDGSKLGTLCIISDAPRTLSAQDREVLRTLASMAEAELASLDPATTDPVTGLANLRGFLETGEFILRLSRKLRHQVQLLLVEVKWTARTAQGKSPLAAFARVLPDIFIESDLVARVGPIRFAAVFAGRAPDCASAEARLVKWVNQQCDDERNPAPVTVSTAAVMYDPMRHQSLEVMLSQAEQSLPTQNSVARQFG